jgi:hypothetical protein
MRSLLVLLVFCILSLILAAPSPQDLELVLDSGPNDYDVEEPSLVLVRPSFGGFGRIPGFGQFSGFGNFPSTLPSSFGFENSVPRISISLSDIFGARPSEQGGKVPSILNALFDVLGQQLGVEEGKEDEDRTVSLQEDGEYDHHNQTFEEKVLPDGSVIRSNRTTIQDTDADGNTFFFSTSVHHVLQDGLDTDDEDSTQLDTVSDVDYKQNEEEVEEDETVGEVFRDYEEDAEIVPTDIDESENEIDFENMQDRSSKSEFPGVDATGSVEGLFE